MFDQEQQKLLRHSLAKLNQDYKLNSNVYDVSAFDAKFDQELKKLVIFYSFDFQAIALHLSFKFHQYSHRLKPQAVSYRWYQLTVSRKAENLLQEIMQFPKKQDVYQQTQIQEQNNKMKQQGNQEIAFFSLQQKLMQFQTAMSKAKQLDQQENQSLMFYRPKFIIDSEFKLERQRINAIKDLKPFMENELIVQFGDFSPPQTAPLNILIEEFDLAAPDLEPLNKQKIQEQTYLDEDWQAYQSD